MEAHWQRKRKHAFRGKGKPSFRGKRTAAWSMALGVKVSWANCDYCHQCHRTVWSKEHRLGERRDPSLGLYCLTTRWSLINHNWECWDYGHWLHGSLLMTTTIYNCNSVLNFGCEWNTTYIEVYNLAPKLKK